MAWSASAIMRATVADVLKNLSSALDLDTDVPKVALFNNSITPDKDATAANSAYNTGAWANANEVSEAVTWPAAGVALTTPAITTPTSGVVMYDADDTASGANATLANVYGALVYDDTITTPVADIGLCYNYFGGVQSVTNGTFTVVWNASGIFRITV